MDKCVDEVTCSAEDVQCPRQPLQSH